MLPDGTCEDLELDGRAAEYFRRSYTSVDGLWFLKVEEQLGFEGALALDREVWEVMPKIQARALKAITEEHHGLSALHKCLSKKLRWEGHSHESTWSADGQGLEIGIRQCPWHNSMVKSGREHLSGRVGRAICETEYTVWATEFSHGEAGVSIRFVLRDLLCEGAPTCILSFEEVSLTDPARP